MEGSITNNFSWKELTHSTTAEAKGIDNTPTVDTKAYLVELCVLILQPIRDKYGKSITVNSGYRCKALNKAVGGASTSQHVKGQAADITVGQKQNKVLFDMIVKMIKDKKITVGQLIDEKNYSWLHISLPTDKHKNEILHLK